MVLFQDNLVPITLQSCFATLTEECPKPCESWPLWTLPSTVTGWVQVAGFYFFFHFLYHDELPSSSFVNSAFINRDLHVDMLIALIKCFIIWIPLQNGRKGFFPARGTSHER